MVSRTISSASGVPLATNMWGKLSCLPLDTFTFLMPGIARKALMSLLAAFMASTGTSTDHSFGTPADHSPAALSLCFFLDAGAGAGDSGAIDSSAGAGAGAGVMGAGVMGAGCACGGQGAVQSRLADAVYTLFFFTFSKKASIVSPLWHWPLATQSLQREQPSPLPHCVLE